MNVIAFSGSLKDSGTPAWQRRQAVRAFEAYRVLVALETERARAVEKLVMTIEGREAQQGRDAMCSVPKAHHVRAQGNALGKCDTNVPSPNGAKGSCLLLTPLQGFPAGDCLFPGAMPQAFTLCRVTAKPFGHASRGEPRSSQRGLRSQPWEERERVFNRGFRGFHR